MGRWEHGRTGWAAGQNDGTFKPNPGARPPESPCMATTFCNIILHEMPSGQSNVSGSYANVCERPRPQWPFIIYLPSFPSDCTAYLHCSVNGCEGSCGSIKSKFHSTWDTLLTVPCTSLVAQSLASFTEPTKTVSFVVLEFPNSLKVRLARCNHSTYASFVILSTG